MSLKNKEICKVRNSAINREGCGYTLAVLQKGNKCNAHIVVIDDSKNHKVNWNMLWKVKSAQRKVLQQKMKAALSPPPPSPISPTPPSPTLVLPSITFGDEFMFGLKSVAKFTLNVGTVLHIANDSVLKFTGDAIVNAANTGCIDGGGIDGEVNRLGGPELFQARCQLPLVIDSDNDFDGVRCLTGDAKLTISGKLPCKYVIHAVGPRFASWDDTDHTYDINYLEKAYKSAMERAAEKEVESLAFCLISAGIYSGSCPLRTIIEIGLKTIVKYAYDGLKTVVLCGFTKEEQMELKRIMKIFESIPHWCQVMNPKLNIKSY